MQQTLAVERAVKEGIASCQKQAIEALVDRQEAQEDSKTQLLIIYCICMQKGLIRRGSIHMCADDDDEMMIDHVC